MGRSFRHAPVRRTAPKVSVHSATDRWLVISVAPRVSRGAISAHKSPVQVLARAAHNPVKSLPPDTGSSGA